jgi:PKD repeat protein
MKAKAFSSIVVLTTLALLLSGLAPAKANTPTMPQEVAPKPATAGSLQAKVTEALHSSPVMFIQNVGQFDEKARLHERDTLNASVTTAAAWNVELVGQIGGATYAVAVQGSYAYIGVGPRLVILDVSDPAHPAVIGQTGVLPGIVQGVAVSGNYAYVADGGGGLRIINISDPAHPSEVGFYDTPGVAYGVAVSGNYAYVADGGAGLRIINVANPAHPTEAGFYDTPGYAFGVAVSGNYAYVADDYAGLRIINVADPAYPTEAGYCETLYYARGVAVSGNYAYVADDYAGLRIINVADPAYPTEVGFYDTPGVAYGVAVSGSYAYVADWDAGLRIINVADPAHPSQASFYDTPGWAESVAVAGNYAYVADGYGGQRLRIINVSNPAHPTEAGFYDTPGYAFGVAVSGGYAYVADGYAGLRVINVADPAHPTEAGFYDTPGWAEGVAVAGNYAYVADGGSGLRIINVSNPAHPTEAGFYDTPGDARDVAVSGNYAYVADDYAGLRIINVADPAYPTEAGFYDALGVAYGVAVSGSYAYVANRDGGLRIINVADPAHPRQASFYDTPGWAYDVAVSGNYAYIADGWMGLRIINVSNPAAPTEVGSYDTPGDARGVAVAGNYAYLADEDGGLFILRFTGGATYSISGRVVDGSGNPIAGVTVSAGANAFAVTDASGTYIITGLPARTYVVTASKSGYTFSPAARIVRVPPNANGQDFTTVPLYGAIQGHVTAQSSGVAIVNAHVSVGGKVGYTDGNGHYMLTGILPGLHNILVSADGYEDYKGEVTIEANSTTTMDIVLKPFNTSGYYLPYPGGTTYKCTQGNGGPFSHQGNWYYAFDFGMPDGHKVVASREGRVVAIKKDSNTGCNSKACNKQANYVRIRHQDGTDTLYYHLKYRGVFVELNQFVSRGQVIAESDTTGWVTGAHLDFTRHKWGQWRSIPISFADVPGDGVPKTGGWYTSGNYPTGGTTALEAMADTDPPQGNVQFRLTGEPTHTLILEAFDYAADVTAMRLAATEYELQTATWVSYTTRTVWTEPAVFAQFMDSNGNVSAIVSATIDPIAYEPIQAAFAVSPTICVGEGLSLTNQTTPFCEQCGWLWDFGDGTTSEEAEPHFDFTGISGFSGYAAPGTYTITLNVSNAFTRSLVSHQVEVLPAPSADFTIIRSGATITVEAKATEAASWLWDFGDGTTATGRTATHTYTDTANLALYLVRLIVKGNNGCIGVGYKYVGQEWKIYLPLVLRNYR